MTTQSTGKQKYLNWAFTNPTGDSSYVGQSPSTSATSERFRNTFRSLSSKTMKGMGISVSEEASIPDKFGTHMSSIPDEFDKAVRSELKNGQDGMHNLATKSDQVMETLIAAAKKQDEEELRKALAEMSKQTKKRKNRAEGSHSPFKMVYHAVTNTFEQDAPPKDKGEEEITPKKGGGNPGGKDEQAIAEAAAAQAKMDAELAKERQFWEDARKKAIADKMWDATFESENKRRARKCRNRKYREAHPYSCS